MTTEPHLLARAQNYLRAGWHPFPLPAGAKAPPPDGRTGRGGSDMTTAEIEAAEWSGNIAVRMPPDVIGLDVDVYRGGDGTLKELFVRCGELPATWISHSGRWDGSGIRFFRVPPGLVWVAGLAGVDIIQRGHRYAVVAPSTHPEGRLYEWINQSEPTETGYPDVDSLPELPWSWIRELSRAKAADVAYLAQAVDHDGLSAFLDDHNVAGAPSYVGTILAHFTDRRGQGFSRHDTMQHCLIWSMECVRAGLAAGRPTVDLFAQLWVEAVAPDARRAELFSTRRTTEFEAMLRHAVGKVMVKPEAEMHRLHDDIAGITMNVPAPAVRVEESGGDEHPDDGLPRPIDWAEFSRRNDADERWLVPGFWPWGRSMALWASAKVGKSELALWCAVRLALGEDPWMGAAIEPVDIAYFDYEMTPNDLDDRLSAFGVDPERLAHLHYFQLPALHPLDSEAGGREIETLATRYGAKAVIIDTFTRAVAGEENDADTVRAFYQHAGSRLKRAGIGCLRLDHAGKDRSRGQRGTSAKRDDVDIIWSMKRADGGGFVLDCTESTRLDWVDPKLAVERVVEDDEIRYRASVLPWPAGTADKAKQLVTAGVPLAASRREAATLLRAAGIKPGRTTVLCAALKYRRQGGGTTPRRSVSLDELENGGTR